MCKMTGRRDLLGLRDRINSYSIRESFSQPLDRVPGRHSYRDLGLVHTHRSVGTRKANGVTLLLPSSHDPLQDSCKQWSVSRSTRRTGNTPSRTVIGANCLHPWYSVFLIQGTGSEGFRPVTVSGLNLGSLVGRLWNGGTNTDSVI